MSANEIPHIRGINASAGSSPNKSRMAQLDDLITSGKTILYKGNNFKDDRTAVPQFVKDHRPLNTAMLGTVNVLYKDPCHCCIPSYGPTEAKFDLADATGVIDHVRKAKKSGEPLDILFTSPALYKQVKGTIERISPETKLIVAIDFRDDETSASELRQQGIPAIDRDDYHRCAPLNAVIALTVFDELMTS